MGFIIVILFIILKIYEYSKNHFSQTQITTNQCISYITEEITAMGHIETNNIFELTPEHILESEFRMSKAVTSRKIDSISSELENVSSEKNNIIETANSKEIEDEEEVDITTITITTMEEIIIVHKKRIGGGKFVVEVGIKKSTTTKTPSNERLIIWNHNDELLKVINNYKEALVG